MKCPICPDVKMREIEKDGVLIDICPECKGVWLDRGELDKLLQGVKEVREDFNQWYHGHHGHHGSHGHHKNHYGNPYYSSHKKRKKTVLDLLGDIFD
ncbi:zf-TFIIB domain-containing protein [Microaerobacter geothermalis]|uniref:TFIIB-type zinc ribbon-containing protein n=1 Tax=Microaerobacter geothermalis TaxID=674972 RepID=UPI001F4678ED|nr:zf-TFIIB domain-containing protein [Microaerobacter geothermalis]MCF6094722.1 zf-TFIIB domain-containing protein [Microaerobacter geothermalis]